MSLLSQLRKDAGFWGVCPCCRGDFPLLDAQLFELSGDLPEAALARIAELKAELKSQRQHLARTRELMTKRASATAEAVHIGKICEKIVPSFVGFPFAASDCRSLLEPIDFVVFSGLTATGAARSIEFVEVKTGQSPLSTTQKSIAALVAASKIEFDVIRARET